MVSVELIIIRYLYFFIADFSCAFMGDILLQGHLYVSQNWFCFYSRIRGRGRLVSNIFVGSWPTDDIFRLGRT